MSVTGSDVHSISFFVAAALLVGLRPSWGYASSACLPDSESILSRWRLFFTF